jgi:hypothetical protein
MILQTGKVDDVEVARNIFSTDKWWEWNFF